jgi:hypothetical protein
MRLVISCGGYLDDKRRPRSMPKKGLFAKGASGEAGSRQSHFEPFQAADGGPPANRPFRDPRDGSRPVNFCLGGVASATTS